VILGYSRSQPAHPVITIPHNLIVIQTTSIVTNLDKLVAKLFSRGENASGRRIDRRPSTADFQASEGLRAFWDVD
jgi:hypothetical protein